MKSNKRTYIAAGVSQGQLAPALQLSYPDDLQCEYDAHSVNPPTGGNVLMRKGQPAKVGSAQRVNLQQTESFRTLCNPPGKQTQPEPSIFWSSPINNTQTHVPKPHIESAQNKQDSLSNTQKTNIRKRKHHSILKTNPVKNSRGKQQLIAALQRKNKRS